MNAHRINIFDGTDDDAVIRLVADHFHLIFLPANDAFLNQHFRGGGSVEAAGNDLLKFLAVIGDTAAGAAEGKGRTDDTR